ncbi:MAG: hypothetical protein SGJ02_07775, partial [bacterium]|nr:hypothetical protein [bacterium]
PKVLDSPVQRWGEYVVADIIGRSRSINLTSTAPNQTLTFNILNENHAPELVVFAVMTDDNLPAGERAVSPPLILRR